MRLFKKVPVGGKLNEAVVTFVPEARKVRIAFGTERAALTIRWLPKYSDLCCSGGWHERWLRLHVYWAYPENGCRVRPANAPARYNGGILCDMDVGPCACGAWHRPDEANR